MTSIKIENVEKSVALLVRVWDQNDSSGIPKTIPLKAGEVSNPFTVLTNASDGTSSIKWFSCATGYDPGQGGPTAVTDGKKYPVTAGPVSKS
jgi:hypothetical protein